MESDDEQQQTSSFFEGRYFASKSDIIQAVVEYNPMCCNRRFRVVLSDKRRYKAVCTQPDCFFVVQFTFSQTFGPPTKFSVHSCQVSESSKASRRHETAKQIAANPAVRDMAMTFGRKVTPIMIQTKLKNEGILATYMNFAHALKRLKLEIFGSDVENGFPCSWTSNLRFSHVAEPKIRGHGVKHEMVNDELMRLGVIFREGLQAFKPYSERGISVDGTFMKTSVGGVLLVE
uniref:AlNc14C109G6316 protein n=1 Tax=Albugo laibachii Nc14 TaxID=890382 RepID=F0WIB2_9STRA|nr:AlNc14C109G6316 [Albugo laibachii Nc14]|eukprot:CCA20991.1 AlNc14C109G6316 [Albugo laibachii Nc14]